MIASEPNTLCGVGYDLGAPGGDQTVFASMTMYGRVVTVVRHEPSTGPVTMQEILASLARAAARHRLASRGLSVTCRRRGDVS